MIRQCAWCPEILGEVPPYSDTRTTHGICRPCLVQQLAPSHAHRCDRCGLTWEHEEGHDHDALAHACPRCGKRMELVHPNRKDSTMLVLTRKFGESIVIGDNVTVTIYPLGGDKVRVGVTAPKEVSVHRQEVFKVLQQAEKQQKT